MTDDQERTQYHAVLVPVAEECFTNGHTLIHWPDHLTCADCETVAAQAAVDGIDVDTAILAFRASKPV